jgi:hypothetical protein
MKPTYLTIFFLFVSYLVFSQPVLLKGIIKDEQTLKPIQDVNIKVFGSTKGTSTDKTGNFSLTFDKTPVALIFTCIGYETATFEVTRVSGKTIEFLLRPKSYLLQEVDISSKKYSFMFKDKDYSVLDYEILGDHIVLLIFKYQLKEAELVLLARSGDTLAFSSLPEVPPANLFKDFLANVHYISKAQNAYQFLYDEKNARIAFYRGKPLDSLQAFVKPFIFKMSDRLYFQEKIAAGFGTAFGYYEKGTGKKYIRRYVNEKNLSKYGDDQAFYQDWNGKVPTAHYFMRDYEYNEIPEFNFSAGFASSTQFEENEARAHQFEFYKMVYPVVKTSDETIAFFNFACDTIEMMDKNGKIENSVPITFHKEVKAPSDTASAIKLSYSDWRWGSTILVDNYSGEVYTMFLKNGMVKVQRVDLETGKLHAGTVLPFPYPEKIQIYKGEAYFLVKTDGLNDKWKLVKCRIG